MTDTLVHASLPKSLIISLGNIARHRIVGSESAHTPIHLYITYGGFHPITVKLNSWNMDPTSLQYLASGPLQKSLPTADLESSVR